MTNTGTPISGLRRLLVSGGALAFALAPTDAQAQDREWQLGAPTTVIEQDAYTLASIRAAAVLPNRSVVVVDATAGEVVVFDSAGTFVKVVGRKGEGPGEFGYPRSMSFIGGQIVIHDSLERRVTFFDAEGTLVGTYRDVEASGEPASTVTVVPTGPNSLVAHLRKARVRGQRSPTGLHRDTTFLVRWRVGEPPDTLAPTVSGPRVRVRRGGAALSQTPPLSPKLLIAMSGSGVAWGLSNDSAVSFVRPNEDRVRSVTVPFDQRRATRADRRLGQQNAIRSAGPDFGGADWTEHIEAIVAAAPEVEMLPRISDMWLDPMGRIWFMEYSVVADEVARWRVVDLERPGWSRIELPGDAELVDAGPDFLALVRKDPLGTPVLSVHPLIVPGDR